MRRSALTVLLVVAAVYLMGPLQQWPASTILFSDGVLLSERYDDLCADAIMLGIATGTQRTDTTADNVFFPLSYPEASKNVTYNPQSCWTKASNDQVEFIYNCGDGLSRTFKAKFLSPMFPTTGLENVRVFFGVHAGGDVVDGDQNTTVVNQFTLPNFSYKLTTVAADLTLNEGDRVAVGILQAAGSPASVLLTGFEIIMNQSECLGDSGV